MKNKFSLALAALITVSLAVPVLVFAQPRGSQTNRSAERQANRSAGARTNGKSEPSSAPNRRTGVRVTGDTPEAVADDFKEALGIIQQNYVDGSKLDFNSVYKSSIMGMLRTLDPHSNYFDKEEFDELKTDQRSEYFGIGASIQNYVTGDSFDTYVTATFDNSPASRAGLRFGDRIDEVDGVSMHAKLSAEVRDKIRGPQGSHVKLTLTRAATGKIETVEITRHSVPQPSVPDYYMIRPGVGYVDMTRGFNYDTTQGLQDALEHLHRQGMLSLVLDLRNNPGGFLDKAIEVAETFLPAGQLILTQKGRDGTMNTRTYTSRNPDPDRTPLVILVNDFTASASEIVAGAMQDHDRALIVGQTSFGKGLVQSIIPLPESAGLTLTSAKYYTPSGRLIQRDYSDGGWYNYIYRGGTLRDSDQSKPVGPARHTDTGRPVYGGGGITPDEPVKRQTLTNMENRLRDPAFFFAREIANGRVTGLDRYKIDRPIEFGHDLGPNDLPMNDMVFNAFKDYVAKDADWKIFTPQLDRNRAFIEQQLRFQLATAAYGAVTSLQVLTKDDPQIAKAIEIVPRARDLAMAAMRARLTQP